MIYGVGQIWGTDIKEYDIIFLYIDILITLWQCFLMNAKWQSRLWNIDTDNALSRLPFVEVKFDCEMT